MKNIWKKILLLLGVLFALAACSKSVQQQAAEQLELGQRYLTEGKYEEAIVAFNKVIELDPNEVQAYTRVITAYIELGRESEAETMIGTCLSYFEQANAQIEENYWGEFLEKAEIYYESKNDLNASLSYWKRISSMEPINEIHKEKVDYYQDNLVERYLQLGRECQKNEDYNAAIEAFERVIEIELNNTEAYLELADIYNKIQDNKKAAGILEQGYEVTQDERLIVAWRKCQKNIEKQEESLRERERIEKLAAENGQQVIFVTSSQPLWKVLDTYMSNIYIVLEGKDYYVNNLNISGHENVTICGEEGTRIVSSSENDTILIIHDSKNITLQNIVLGHDLPTDKEYDCPEGVLQNWNSELTLINCDIFGCGLYGINVSNSTITAKNTTIRDCSRNIMSVYDSTASFQKCKFLRNGYKYPSVDAISTDSGGDSTLTFSECIFSENNNPNCITDKTNYTLDECIFYGNGWGGDNVSSMPEV